MSHYVRSQCTEATAKAHKFSEKKGVPKKDFVIELLKRRKEDGFGGARLLLKGKWEDESKLQKKARPLASRQAFPNVLSQQDYFTTAKLNFLNAFLSWSTSIALL